MSLYKEIGKDKESDSLNQARFRFFLDRAYDKLFKKLKELPVYMGTHNDGMMKQRTLEALKETFYGKQEQEY